MIDPTREVTPHVAAVLARRRIYRHEAEMARVVGLMAKGVGLKDIKTQLGYDALRECYKRAQTLNLLNIIGEKK